MTIDELFTKFHGRSYMTLRLCLFDCSLTYRCNLNKLLKVFELADQFGIQEILSTNTNRRNAVHISLDNFVLLHRDYVSAKKDGWGDHYGFALACAKEFPGQCFIDPPEGIMRYEFDHKGNITREIETDDGGC